MCRWKLSHKFDRLVDDDHFYGILMALVLTDARSFEQSVLVSGDVDLLHEEMAVECILTSTPVTGRRLQAALEKLGRV